MVTIAVPRTSFLKWLYAKNARSLARARLVIHMEKVMSKVLVLYYSSYGHIESMAEAMADGARAEGATVDLSLIHI